MVSTIFLRKIALTKIIQINGSLQLRREFSRKYVNDTLSKVPGIHIIEMKTECCDLVDEVKS